MLYHPPLGKEVRKVGFGENKNGPIVSWNIDSNNWSRHSPELLEATGNDDLNWRYCNWCRSYSNCKCSSSDNSPNGRTNKEISPAKQVMFG